jgi:hypothetical protein
MPDIEELLSSFEGEEEVPQVEDPKEQGNSTIEQMRFALERREKAFRKATKEIEELKAFQVKTLEEARKGTLVAAGFNEDQIQVFSKAYDEVTPETIDAFRTKVLGVAVPSEETPASPPTGFAPTALGGPPPARTFTTAEWDALYKSDPDAAAKALRENRMQRPQVQTAGPEW